MDREFNTFRDLYNEMLRQKHKYSKSLADYIFSVQSQLIDVEAMSRKKNKLLGYDESIRGLIRLAHNKFPEEYELYKIELYKIINRLDIELSQLP